MSVIFGCTMVMVGSWVFVSNYKHMLSMLLSLEIMVLGLYTILFFCCSFMDNEFILMLFLGFAVCEGSVGLGLLVYFVRLHGNDWFSSMASLWC